MCSWPRLLELAWFGSWCCINICTVNHWEVLGSVALHCLDTFYLMASLVCFIMNYDLLQLL